MSPHPVTLSWSLRLRVCDCPGAAETEQRLQEGLMRSQESGFSGISTFFWLLSEKEFIPGRSYPRRTRPPYFWSLGIFDTPEKLSVMDGEWSSCDDGNLTKPHMESDEEEGEISCVIKGEISCGQETMLRRCISKERSDVKQQRTLSAMLSNVSSSQDCSSNQTDLVENLTTGMNDGVGPSGEESPMTTHQTDYKQKTTPGSSEFVEELTLIPSLSTRRKPLHCSICQKSFTRKDNFLIHQRIHAGEKPYACAECDKCFSRKSTLHLHEKLHTGERPFACLECDKCFTTSSCLTKHRRTHSGERPFPCSICEKRFFRRAHLQNHLKTHMDEKSFACSECGKRYSSLTILTTHQRIHTGEKPYECLECGKFFRTRQVFVVHERTHTGEKPYACTECGRRFSAQGNLTAHEKAHKGEKPYVCSDCGKCFLRRAKLMRHERIHSRETI